MMKKKVFQKAGLCFLALFILLVPSTAHAAKPDAEVPVYGSYIRNDVTIYYCKHRGVTVTVDITNGLDIPEISIVNEGESEFLFDPLKIVASNYMVKGAYRDVRHKIGQFPFQKEDLERLARDTMEVYPYKKYAGRVNRTMFWGDMLGGLSTAMLYLDGEGFGKLIQYLEDRRRQDENAAALKRVDEGYWRSNTIFPHSSHKGFVAIKGPKGDNLILDIPVNGIVCHFEILPEKYM